VSTPLALGDPVADGEGERDRGAVADGDGLDDCDTRGDALGVRLTSADMLAEGERESSPLVEGAPDVETELLGEPLGESVARRTEGDTLGVAEGEREPLGDPLGERLPRADMDRDGEPEDDTDALPLPLGDAEGDAVIDSEEEAVTDADTASGEEVTDVDCVGDGENVALGL
jgi:hypothetical protein